MAIGKDICKKWDSDFATDDFNQAVAEIEKNGVKKGDFPEVPVGKYEVKIKSLELGESKNGDPMLKASFKILKGAYTGQRLFMNNVLTSRQRNIHDANEFLRSLETDVTVEWEGSFTKYQETILDVFEATSGLEYDLDFSKTEKGFPIYEIIGVYESKN
jgi:hypothetical protein